MREKVTGCQWTSMRVRVVDGVEDSVVDEEVGEGGLPDVGFEAVNPR